MGATKYEHFEDSPMADDPKPTPPKQQPICMVARDETSQVRAQTYTAHPYNTTAGRAVVAIIAPQAELPAAPPEPAAPAQVPAPAAPASDSKQVASPKS